jgi:hypothetical protein
MGLSDRSVHKNLQGDFFKFGPPKAKPATLSLGSARFIGAIKE